MGGEKDGKDKEWKIGRIIRVGEGEEAISGVPSLLTGCRMRCGGTTASMRKTQPSLGGAPQDSRKTSTRGCFESGVHVVCTKG